ncbi:MAG: zinc-ribbon domain-containing protein [Oscillospiraceae bacterium]|nr:zinc-ribbon domain-containing protein [Oscillospiraceae bacterium]
MFCKNCGAEIASNNRFCSMCGAAQEALAPVETVIPSAPPVEGASAFVVTTDVPDEAAVPFAENAVSADANVDAPNTETIDAPTDAEASPAGSTSDSTDAVVAPVQPEPVQQMEYQPNQPQPYQQQPYQQPQQPYQQQPYDPAQPYQQQPYDPAQPYQQQPYDPAQPYQQYQPYPQPPQPPSDDAEKANKKRLLKIIIPVAAAAVVVVAAFIVLTMFLASPLRTVNNAMLNVGDEFSERMEDTPLEMFGMLFESLNDGSVTVGFDYQMFLAEASGELTLHSDYDRGAHLIEAAVSVYGLDIDLELYRNNEIMAARIGQISNNFYGIVFDTFRDDFRPFADLLGLSRQEVDEIVDMIETYETVPNALFNMDNFTERFEDMVSDLLRRIEVTSNNVDIISGGESVNVRRVDFTISAELMVEFFERFLDIVEEDESINAFFDSFNSLIISTDPWADEISLEEIIREGRREMREMHDMQGEMSMSFYVGRGDRLYRLVYKIDMGFDGNRTEVSMIFDLGSHVNDVWSLGIESRADWGRSEFVVEWEVNETSGGGETILRVNEDDRWGNWTSELILEWTDRGDFILSLDDNGRNQETLLTGEYTISEDGFILRLLDLIEDSLFFEQHLNLEISTARRTERLEPVEFVNIAAWDQRLIDQIMDFVGLGGMLFAPDLDDWLDMDFDDLPVYLPVPAPDTTPPTRPGGTAVDLSDHELIGIWEFSDGSFTWFFEVSDFVWFAEDGYVYTDTDIGIWNVDGNRLTVTGDFGEGRTYEFYFEVDGDILAITDIDDDTGYFERMW